MPVTLIENFRAVFYAPFYACAALGAYEAEGIEVVMKMSEAAERTLTSLASGAGEVSWGGPLRVMKALDGDPEGGYVAFCEVVGRDPFHLVGREPNPQFAMKDLLEKRVAVVSEVPTPWICLQQDLRGAGIDPAGVALGAGRSMADNVAALRAGEVDVIQVFQPYAQELLAAGEGHPWYAAASRGLTTYTTFNTTRAFIAQNPDLVQRMTRAMYRTLKWIAAHDGRALSEAIGDYLPGVPQATLTACCEGYKSLGVWNASPVMQRRGFEWLRDAMLAAGYIKTRHTFEDCVDPRFAERVLREDPPSI